MKKNKRNKNYLLLALQGLALICLFSFPIKGIYAEPSTQFNNATSAQSGNRSTTLGKENNKFSNTVEVAGENNNIEIIVGDKPLAIPNDFSNTLQNVKGLSLIIGTEDGKFHLLSADGKYINPCQFKPKKIKNPSTSGQDPSPCQLDGNTTLGDIHAAIETRVSAIAQPTTFGGFRHGHHLTALHHTPPSAHALSTGCGFCYDNGAERVCKKSSQRYSCSGQGKPCDEDTCN